MDAIDLKPGMVIEVDGSFYSVISATHTHAQQRRAVIRVKAKELKTGRANEFVWRSDFRINHILIEEISLSYLYRDASDFHFMNSLTYEEIVLSSDVIADKKVYLKENMEVTGLAYEGNVLDINIPIFMELKIVETEPGFKGDTVQSAKKPAKLETGLVIQVPLFINTGDTVKIDTRTNEYQTRV
ncbi:MAG: elongation factor P [Candidatus Omnitrophica bacterium]|nr:elongation factor P [Candidatus Omnitrophota bacterium]